ncbi:MAG: virulence RhuM family protein [Paludibacteraceae bacterium]|nr:virulence RhuM family protein [Paludibacteraceae bacterium]
MTNEIVLYQPDESVQLEVRLEDDTVWLTQQQMAELFQKDISVISRHIKNAFAEGELDEKSNLHFLQVPNSDRPARLYDLDVIISVGYRVKSKRGTQFRRWASRILKEYMLKGYAVNQRLLAIEDRMDRRLQEHTEQIHELQDKVDFFVRTNMPPAEQIFFEGEFFGARVLLEKLIKMATKRVIIIDGYIDAETFDMLDVRAKGVSADIYSDGEHKSLRDMHNAGKGKQPVNTHKWSKSSHDRWVIIDDTLYHCGHSVKDLGKKLSAIMKMDWNPDVVLKEVK